MMIPSQISYSASQGAYYIPGQVRLQSWGWSPTLLSTLTLLQFMSPGEVGLVWPWTRRACVLVLSCPLSLCSVLRSP